MVIVKICQLLFLPTANFFKMNLRLQPPSQQFFSDICSFINEFELDNRNLISSEFTAALREDQLVGFGRLRRHSDCLELCSLGVITPYRRQGIGKAIVAELIKRSDTELFLTCIIPEFFTPFGFQIVENYPKAMQNKLEYCTRELVVPEKYVVMKLFS